MTYRDSNSIDDWLQRGETATVWCHNSRCGHRGQLDLEPLKRKLGGQHGMLLDEIKYVLKCSKCGGKEIGMTRHPNTDVRVPYALADCFGFSCDPFRRHVRLSLFALRILDLWQKAIVRLALDG